MALEVPLTDEGALPPAGDDPRPGGQPAVVPRPAVRWRALLLWVIPALVVGAAISVWGSAGRYVATDNAYVQQDRIDVAPQVSGEVRQVFVTENQRVQAGDRLLALDDSVPRAATHLAEARLNEARGDVETLKAAYREKQGEVALARTTASYSVREYERQRELARQKLVADATVDSAHRTADVAVGTIDVLELQLRQAGARLGGPPDIPTDDHPTVVAAAAELERARIDLEHTIIHAPQAGVVSHLPKVGDRLLAGSNALAIVADQSLWVEGNFKETDLAEVRPGQPAVVTIDTYGGRTWQGHVDSISQATGAEFALLPPQNASGNWVKVVQRIAVRIVLDDPAGEPPLRSGMSAGVEIDTGARSRFARWLAHVG